MSPRIDVATLSYRAFVIVFGWIGVFILVGPVVLGLVMSFTAGETMRFPPEGFSLRWYGAALDPELSGPLHAAALTSLQIAVLAALGALIVAVPAALGAPRISGRLAGPLEALLLSPLVLPSLVYGIAALITATLVGLGPSRLLVVAGHVVVLSPLLYRATVAITAGLDRSLEEAAATLGSHPARTFFRVLLPLLAPGIMAGAFLVFMASFDNVTITIFLADPGTSVLPIRLWEMIETSLDARVAAIAGLLITITFALVLLAQRVAPLFRPRD
jgi:putative spermidine/putrescine transport system permease protein